MLNLNLDHTHIAEPIRFRLQKVGAEIAGEDAFRLPNGRIFIAAKLGKGDKLAVQSQLNRLEKLLAEPNVQEPTTQVVAPTTPVVVPPASVVISLADRIEKRISQEEKKQQDLLDEAAIHEKQANALKALKNVLGDMPDAEGILDSLFAKPELPVPPKPDPPPQVITDRVQVTRQLVFVATQTFQNAFKLDDLVDVMTQGKKVYDSERTRIRSCVAAMTVSMVARGELFKVAEGRGKTPAVYEKAPHKAFFAGN